MQVQNASSAIVFRDGNFLLVRRKNPPSLDMFAFPGGRAEPGETPEETALRELEEETGILARNPVLFATYDLQGEGSEHHFFLSVFAVEVDFDCEPVANDDALEAGWFSLAAMRELSMPPSVLECAERLAGEMNGSEDARDLLGTRT